MAGSKATFVYIGTYPDYRGYLRRHGLLPVQVKYVGSASQVRGLNTTGVDIVWGDTKLPDHAQVELELKACMALSS